MQSNFQRTGRKRRRAADIRIDETYDLRGLNQLAPDQVMPNNESPFTTNARMYAADIEEASVAIRTRKGSQILSTPVGQAAGVANTAASTGDLEVSADLWILQPFTASSSGVLTKLEPHVKQGTIGSGHLIMEIYSDSGGNPDELLGQSSILNSAIAAAYAYVPSYWMDCPTIANGDDYWILYKVQEGGTATFMLNQTAASGAKSTPDMESFTPLGVTTRYKTYLSTAGEIIGSTRRYPQDGEKRTYFAMNDNLYEVTDAGVPTSIHSSIHANATHVRFEHIDDSMIFVDGESSAKWLREGTVQTMAGVPGTPTHVWINHNRAFFVPKDDPNRVNFSELYNFESYRSVDFFYVDRPKNSDHIAGGISYQENLVVFTHETKHTIFGTDLASFTRREHKGTKGAVGQEAICTDNNYIYFMADDKNIYRWNGVKDKKLSAKVERELKQIQDVSKVRMHIYNQQLRVYYSKAPDVSVEHMLILELDEEVPNKYLQWFKDTGRAVGNSLEWFQDDNELIEFSSKCGWMFYGERGDSDLGKAIDFKYWTGFKIYGSGAAKDRIKRFRPLVRPADAPYYLQVGKAIDFQETGVTLQPWLVDAGGAVWGSFVFGDGTVFGRGKRIVDNVAPMSGRGKATQFRFECSLVEVPVMIYGYFAKIKSGTPR